MGAIANFSFDDSGLWKLAALLSKDESVKIGILGDKNQRQLLPGEDSNMTNSFIGAIHEFGSMSRNIPKRSFLRMPLLVHGKKAVHEAKDSFLYAIKNNQIGAFYQKVGAAMVGIIDDAFASSGFGTWLPLKPGTIRGRARRAAKPGALRERMVQGQHSPLVDTGELRRSISYKVVKGGG